MNNDLTKRYDRDTMTRGLPGRSFCWKWYPPDTNHKQGLDRTGPYNVPRRNGEIPVMVDLTPSKGKTKPQSAAVLHWDKHSLPLNHNG